EAERLQEAGRDAPPGEPAREAALDPLVPRRGRETAEAAKVARGERRGLPGAQQETDLALRLGRHAGQVAPSALRGADVARAELKTAGGRTQRHGDAALRIQLRCRRE